LTTAKAGMAVWSRRANAQERDEKQQQREAHRSPGSRVQGCAAADVHAADGQTHHDAAAIWQDSRLLLVQHCLDVLVSTRRFATGAGNVAARTLTVAVHKERLRRCQTCCMRAQPRAAAAGHTEATVSPWHSPSRMKDGGHIPYTPLAHNKYMLNAKIVEHQSRLKACLSWMRPRAHGATTE
jgi:hypothetical protein